MKNSEDGSVAIIVGIFLVSVIFAILALSIDMGQNQTEVVDNMGAVEAAATGGATYIQQYQINYAQQNANSSDWQNKVPKNEELVPYAYKIYKNNVHDQSIGVPIPPDSGDNNAFKACYTAPGAADCMASSSSSNVTQTNTKYASLAFDALNPAAGAGDSEGSFSVKGCMKITPHGVAAAAGMATSSVVCSTRKVAIKCTALNQTRYKACDGTISNTGPGQKQNATMTCNAAAPIFWVNDGPAPVCPTTNNSCLNGASEQATNYWGLDGLGGGANADAHAAQHLTLGAGPYVDRSVNLQIVNSNLNPDFTAQLVDHLSGTKISNQYPGYGHYPSGSFNIEGDPITVSTMYGPIEQDGQDQICCHAGLQHERYNDVEKFVEWSGDHCSKDCLQEAKGSATIGDPGVTDEKSAIASAKDKTDQAIDAWPVSDDAKGQAHAALAQAISKGVLTYTYYADATMDDYAIINGFVMYFKNAKTPMYDNSGKMIPGPDRKSDGTYGIDIKKKICPAN